jgi:aminocarboxymuconate-semialdehyde decarboxylase
MTSSPADLHIDFHTHLIPELPDFAERFGDQRWPALVKQGNAGHLMRGGRVVRTVPDTGWSAGRRIEDMDEANIAQQVLSPLPPLVCDWAGADLAAEWALRLNESLAATVAAYPQHFYGLGTVPLHAPEQAISVLEEAHNVELRGVEIGTSAGGIELDDPSLREFFAAAAQLGMLIFVHPLILGAAAGWTQRILGTEVTFGLGMPTDTAIAAAKLVFGGVVEQYPALQICLAHGGGVFVNSLARIGRAWDQQHDRSVADLVRNVFVDSVVYDSVNLRYVAEVLGADRVLFGTDYPLPAQDDLRGGVLSGLDPSSARLVWGVNTAGLLSR